MLQRRGTMTDNMAGSSTAARNLKILLDLPSDSTTSQVICAEPEENVLRTTSPTAPESSPRYNIDVNAMQKNIDKLAMADKVKNKGLTPRDLFEKACPGLLTIPSDVTDPRQWYSSMSSKSMNRKSPRTDKVKKKNVTTKAKKQAVKKSSGKAAAKDDVPSQVAFLVTFPNITKTEGVRLDRTHTRYRSDSESSDKLPPLSNPQSADTEASLSHIQTQIHIRNLVPHIDDSPYQSARRTNRDLAFSDHGSVDSLDIAKYTTTKKGKATKVSNVRQKEDGKVLNHREEETPPSALDRELTKSMEDILKSVTNYGPDSVARSLRQPPNISLQLPQIEKEASSMKHQSDETTEVSADLSRTTSVNWQTDLGLRRTYSYKNLNYTQPMFPYSEDEMSTRLVKASSNENLAQSSTKFKKLRLPEKLSTVERMKSFRNTYTLRQKSMLRLKMKSDYDLHKIPMNKVQVAQSGAVDEYENVSSKIAPYIEGKLPRYFVVAPDLHGDIKPQEVSSELTVELEQPELGQIEPKSVTDEMRLPGTSFSFIPNDDSSEKNTLISKSGDLTSRKSLKDNVLEDKEKERSRSRSKSKHRSKSRSRSRNSNDRNKIKKQRRGALSRGSNVSRSRSRNSSANQTVRNRSKSREKEKKKKLITEDDLRPHPTARSPSSKTVQIKPTHEHHESLIPPPSRKSFSKPYIPAKLKRYKTKYTDSLDSFIHQQGKGSRAAVVSLAVAEKKSQKYRKKLLIRAIDKYLLTKLGDKLYSSQESLAEVHTQPKYPDSDDRHDARHIHLVENGKRPVFRKMKGMVPFDERGRPITRGKDEPVVMEQFPCPVFNPTRRPPTFKMDLKQYPPGNPGPLEREYSYDKRSHTIIPSGLERSVTVGELIFKSPDKMSQAPNDGQFSEISSSMSNLHVAPPKTKHHKKHSRANRLRQQKPGGGSLEFRVIQKGVNSDICSIDATSINESDASRLQTLTPADSITASMMKEIYENLDGYLEENTGQYVENIKQRELIMEG